MRNKRYLITFAITTILSLLFIIVGHNICKTQILESQEEFYKAKVQKIEDVIADEYEVEGLEGGMNSKTIIFVAKISKGELKGQEIVATQYIDYMYAIHPREVKEGDNIIVAKGESQVELESDWIFTEYNRGQKLAVLFISFLAAILIIGRGQGIATILSLLFTIGAVFLVYIPSILAGKNIYISTIIITLFIIFMSIILLNGINKKTVCAIIGNIGGVFISALLALIMNNVLGITGLIEQDYIFLTYLETANPIDLKAIIWGGILIGSLGAIMDVAMSISSAMNEIADTMPEYSPIKMIRSGMNIGKDVIGTMTNTLILAYIGGSLATVLLLIAYNKNWLMIFNMEMIVVEVLQALVGSMGILFAVPVTVLVASYIFKRE